MMTYTLPHINLTLLLHGSARLAFSFACIGLAGQFLGFLSLSPQLAYAIAGYVFLNGFLGVPALGVVNYFLKGVSAQILCPNPDCKNAMIPSNLICPKCGARTEIPYEGNKA